jgi:hypothetical protein
MSYQCTCHTHIHTHTLTAPTLPSQSSTLLDSWVFASVCTTYTRYVCVCVCAYRVHDHHPTPHYTTLHYTTLHYTTLHYTTLHSSGGTARCASISLVAPMWMKRLKSGPSTLLLLHYSSVCALDLRSNRLLYLRSLCRCMRIHTHIHTRIPSSYVLTRLQTHTRAYMHTRETFIRTHQHTHIDIMYSNRTSILTHTHSHTRIIWCDLTSPTCE